MFDGLSLWKVQGQNLPISMHDLSKDVLYIVCQHYHLHTNNQFYIHVGDCWTKTVFFLSIKIELFVDFEPKLKWDPIVILNNILWVHILLSEENNVVYLFVQIE